MNTQANIKTFSPIVQSALDAIPDDFKAASGYTLSTAIPTRTGYRFGGWYLDADCTGDSVTAVTSGQAVAQKGDVLADGDTVYVYAKWNSWTYRVEYRPGDGHADASNMPVGRNTDGTEDTSSHVQCFLYGDVHPTSQVTVSTVQPTDEGYNNKNAWWQKDSQKMFDEKLDPAAVFSPLIKDLSQLDEISTPRKLEDALFAIAVSAQCNSLIDRRLLEFIPIEEICRLYECHNFRFFASKGPDTLYQKGRQWAFVWRTMQDILDKADSDLQTGEYAARLRFGHDGCMMAMFAMLGLEGWTSEIEDPADAWKVWDVSRIPMASNLQLVLFGRGATDPLLLLMLLNEEPVELPLKSVAPGYYLWDEFVAYCSPLIDSAREALSK